MLGEVRYDDMLMQLCPSAGNLDLSRQTKEFKGSTLKYRKIQDLEQDPLFLGYLQKPLFRDLTAKIVGAEISIFRAMFFNKPAEQGVMIQLAPRRRWRLAPEHSPPSHGVDCARRHVRCQRLPANHPRLAPQHDPRNGRPAFG